jgi:hypothetical protein
MESKRRRQWRLRLSYLPLPPAHAGATFLNWTHSRKLLEAAIAVEQQSSAPAAEPPRRPLPEWQALEAAEQRLQAKLHKFGLDMYVMEGDGNCQVWCKCRWGLGMGRQKSQPFLDDCPARVYIGVLATPSPQTPLLVATALPTHPHPRRVTIVGAGSSLAALSAVA